MEKVLRCDCGFEVRAADDDELVAQVQRHALAAHGMRFSPDDVLQLTFRAERRAGTSSSGSEAKPTSTPPDP